MDALQLRRLVVRPALLAVDWWTPAAENLVMGTASVESDLRFVQQIGGPALSFWQVEPRTYWDIWENWLAARSGIAQAIRSACALDPNGIPPLTALQTNLRLGALMCRAVYRRIPAPLPAADDVLGMARYWKAHYNTALGAGTVEGFLRFYLKVHPAMEGRQ